MNLRFSLARRIGTVVAVTGMTCGLIACGSADNPSKSSAPTKFAPVKQAAGSTITVWVDSTRMPAIKAYQKSHPNVKVKPVLYSGDANGANDLQTKIQLFDRAGHGWPDVAFAEPYADAAWSTNRGTDWVAPLNAGLVPQATLSGFAKGALDPCTVSGKVYCLRNDIAQDVTWYDSTLFAKFGYTVPTTWEQYEALGQRVAREHPGYVIGTVGDGYAPEVYFWAARCSASTVQGAKVLINTSDPKCVRMAKVLDAGIKNKSISTEVAFGNNFTKNYADKVLMLIGPSWYGQYFFNSALKVPAGRISAAAPLKWKGESTTSTGNVGGGVWFVSKHSKNLKASADLVSWLTTSNANQVAAPTYPAYKPAAEAWLAKQKQAGYFKGDVGPVFETAAEQIWPGWATTRYSQEQIWSSTITPQLVAGKTVQSLLPAWQRAITNRARTSGYDVTNR